MVYNKNDNPLYIDAYRLGRHYNSFSMFIPVCLMWWFIDYGFYGAVTVYLAWGSIERHILVFHSHQLLRTQRQRFFIHYLPLIILSIYLLALPYLIYLYTFCVLLLPFICLGYLPELWPKILFCKEKRQ